MTTTKEKNLTEKSRKKVYAFSLSEELVNRFNLNVGYLSRSRTVESLIFDFVNGIVRSRKDPKPGIETPHKFGNHRGETT